MNTYIFTLLLFTIICSIADFYTNKNYARVWDKKTTQEKLYMILLLFIHYAIYFFIYVTLIFVILKHKTIKTKYLLLYLFILIIIPLRWYTNNEKCYITELQNKLLEIDEKCRFRDIFALLHDTYVCDETATLKDNVYYYYIFFSMIYVILIISIRLYRFI